MGALADFLPAMRASGRPSHGPPFFQGALPQNAAARMFRAMPPRSPGFSPAAQSLGLAGDVLQTQVKDETDEERKKRMREMQQRELMGDTGSLAAFSLFGGPSGSGV